MVKERKKKEKSDLKMTAPGMDEAVERAKETFLNDSKILKTRTEPVSEPSETETKQTPAANPFEQWKSYSGFEAWNNAFFFQEFLKMYENQVKMYYVFILHFTELITRPFTMPSVNYSIQPLPFWEMMKSWGFPNWDWTKGWIYPFSSLQDDYHQISENFDTRLSEIYEKLDTILKRLP